MFWEQNPPEWRHGAPAHQQAIVILTLSVLTGLDAGTGVPLCLLV